MQIFTNCKFIEWCQTVFLINLVTQPQRPGEGFSKPKRFLDLRIIWSHAHTQPPVILLRSWRPSPEQQMPPAVLMVTIHPSADSFMPRAFKIGSCMRHRYVHQTVQAMTAQRRKSHVISPLHWSQVLVDSWKVKRKDRKCASEAAFTSP